MLQACDGSYKAVTNELNLNKLIESTIDYMEETQNEQTQKIRYAQG